MLSVIRRASSLLEQLGRSSPSQERLTKINVSHW
jgi:hypothetical protein